MRTATLLRHILITLMATMLHGTAKGQELLAAGADSVEISLLTCQPYENAYSLYGHTAIRYHDKARDIDVAVNYGMFSFDKPFFVLRFVFGLTDYEMGIEPFVFFRNQYARRGSGVWEQVLNLTPEEKVMIADAINRNYLPENRVYRYNYFYDNCTTRARDMITNHLTRRVVYSSAKSSYGSYRDWVHQCTRNNPWIRFGNDLLLGVKADLPITQEQYQFLPWNLKADFDGALLYSATGKAEPLVSRSGWVVQPVADTLPVDELAHASTAGFPLSPTACMLLLCGVVLAVTVIERLRNTWFRWFDAAVLFFCGIAGIVLFAMIFSQHPTVSLNLQILFLCPLTFLYIYSCVKPGREKQLRRVLKVWCAMLALFLVGRLFQHYAEGIVFLASSLLFRYTYFIFRSPRT